VRQHVLQSSHKGSEASKADEEEPVLRELCPLLFSCENLQIVEHWGVANVLGLPQQIDAFPKAKS